MFSVWGSPGSPSFSFYWFYSMSCLHCSNDLAVSSIFLSTLALCASLSCMTHSTSVIRPLHIPSTDSPNLSFSRTSWGSLSPFLTSSITFETARTFSFFSKGSAKMKMASRIHSTVWPLAALPSSPSLFSSTFLIYWSAEALSLPISTGIIWCGSILPKI